MKRPAIYLIIVTITLLACLPLRAVAKENTSRAELPAPKLAELDTAILRGVDYLLTHQHPNGCFGSFRSGRPVNVLAPVPGTHYAMRAAVTSLAISSLSELLLLDAKKPFLKAKKRKQVVQCVQNAEKWLIKNLPDVKRCSVTVLYNNWAHAYSLEAITRLTRLHKKDLLPDAASDSISQLKKLAEGQVDRLGRYQDISGGWSYYDFKFPTQQPTGLPTPFLTATVLVALSEMEEIDVKVSKAMVKKAFLSLERTRLGDNSYLYSEDHKYAPRHEINRPAGSLGRTQAGNLAFRLWDVSKESALITDKVVDQWLNRFTHRIDWLDMGRKRPIPHESWCKIAGYFYYYGCYYAGRCAMLLPPKDRLRHLNNLSAALLGIQEKDGSWWDFPLYSYHKEYGTAMALESLIFARDERTE